VGRRVCGGAGVTVCRRSVSGKGVPESGSVRLYGVCGGVGVFVG